MGFANWKGPDGQHCLCPCVQFDLADYRRLLVGMEDQSWDVVVCVDKEQIRPKDRGCEIAIVSHTYSNSL